MENIDSDWNILGELNSSSIEIKKKMRAGMLRHCNQHLPVKLARVTTQYDISTVLSQIIKHGSECLKVFATSYSQLQRKICTTRESLSLIWEVKYFNEYFYGSMGVLNN